MKRYQNILVATNLDNESRIVADKAKIIADQSGAKLNLVHVVSYTPFLYGAGEFAVPLEGDIEESVQKEAQEALTNESKRLGIESTNQWLEKGDAAEGLVTLANKLKIDLLILGSHEHHGLGYLFGSVSNAIFHAMPCDILAIRILIK